MPATTIYEPANLRETKATPAVRRWRRTGLKLLVVAMLAGLLAY